MGNQSAGSKTKERHGKVPHTGKDGVSKEKAEAINKSALVTRAEADVLRLLFAKWLSSYMPAVNARIAEYYLPRHGFASAGSEATDVESTEFILHVETLSGTRLATFKDVDPATCSVAELKQRVEEAVEREEGELSKMGLRLFRSDPRRELASNDAMLDHYGIPSEGTFVLVAIRTGQRQALQALYQATGGKRWAQGTRRGSGFPKWCTDAPLSEWRGVTVDDKGFVVGLYLPDANMRGALPGHIWAHLTTITSIGFQGNAGLVGKIPVELGYLEGLGFLGLEKTGLQAPPGAPIPFNNKYGLYFDTPAQIAEFTKALRHAK